MKKPEEYFMEKCVNPEANEANEANEAKLSGRLISSGCTQTSHSTTNFSPKSPKPMNSCAVCAIPRSVNWLSWMHTSLEGRDSGAGNWILRFIGHLAALLLILTESGDPDPEEECI